VIISNRIHNSHSPILLRAGVARTRVEMRRRGFLPDEESIRCACGAADETVSRLLECKLMGDPVSHSDLAAYNEKAAS